MLKQRREATQSVIDALIPAESAIDTALHQWGTLASAIPAARIASGMAAETGHKAMESAAETFALLIQARAKMLETHDLLSITRTSIGMEDQDFGGLMPKAAMRTQRRLEAVKAA